MARAHVGGDGLAFRCPGCDAAHRITLNPATGWTWDGNLGSPTIRPSVLVRWVGLGVVQQVCHSFVTEGRIQYLGDSTHSLAGKWEDR